jgi:hypothetical protein
MDNFRVALQHLNPSSTISPEDILSCENLVKDYFSTRTSKEPEDWHTQQGYLSGGRNLRPARRSRFAGEEWNDGKLPISEQGVSNEWSGEHTRFQEQTVPLCGKEAVTFMKNHIKDFNENIVSYERGGNEYAHMVIRNKDDPRKAFFIENNDSGSAKHQHGILTTPDMKFWDGGANAGSIRAASIVGINAKDPHNRQECNQWIDTLGWQKWGTSHVRKVFDPRGATVEELNLELNKLL